VKFRQVWKVLFCLGTGVVTAYAAPTERLQLFVDRPVLSAPDKPRQPRLVATVSSIDPQSLGRLSELPSRLYLNTSAGIFTVERTRTEVRGKDSFLWVGHTREDDLDTVVFTMAEGTLYGYLALAGEVWSVEPSEAGSVLVRKADLFAGAFNLDQLSAPPLAPALEADAAQDNGSQIDVLILYTSNLYARHTTQTAAMIQHLVDVANTSYSNSGIQTRLRAVATIQYTGTSAVEGVDACSALQGITTDSVIANLRNQYKADVVCLLRLFTSGSCGCGWVMQTVSNSFAPYSYSVVEVRPASDANPYYCPEISLAHEIGHNMGCAHDRDHASIDGAYSYSYGYDLSGVFATVMSYDSPRILFFSTPFKTYQGYPIGVDAAFPDSADNVRTINNTRGVVANFRLGPAVDLGISKTVSGNLLVGDSAEYTIIVSNVSQVATSGTITVTDLLPEGLSFVSSSGSGWNCTASSGTVSCSRNASMSPGEQSSFMIRMMVSAPAVPAVTNTVYVSVADDSNPDNNEASITNPVFTGTTGYTMLGADGGVFSFGSSNFYGSLPLLGVVPNSPVPVIKHTADEAGYFLMGTDGGMFAFGTALYLGSLPAIGITNSTVDMEISPTGFGYQLLGIDGGIFAFGDSPYYGSLPAWGMSNQGIDMERTPSGRGYWILGIDGGIFSFGDAQFCGSLPHIGVVPASPLRKIKSSVTGLGYYLLGEDGGLFAFGDAPYFGSLPQIGVLARAVDLEIDPTGLGYYILTDEGRVYGFGTVNHFGNLPDFGVHVDNILDMDLNRR